MLTVLADAVLPVEVIADDPIYAVRSVTLSYRTHRTDPPRYLSVYDYRTARRGNDGCWQRGRARRSLTRSRPCSCDRTHLECRRSLALAALTHLDGTSLQEGDVLILQALADDFDDVTVNKQPGRSGEIEIRIVGT